MTTEQIRATFAAPDDWMRKRKVKDRAGNIVREFQNKGFDFLYLYVVTDPADAQVMQQISFDGGRGVPTTEALKDPSRAWWVSGAAPSGALEAAQAAFDDLSDRAKADNRHVFVVLHDDEEDMTFFYVTPLLFWQAEHCLDDQSLSGEAVAQFGLVESMESVYEPEDPDKDPEEIRQALLAAGFIEDPAFAKFIKRSHGG